ncbi:hypothetical protein AB3662_28905 [Sorangium cellulosum]|uniref:hypothetical protein n=1 Tax=Sorangium cellulosum TaxID=56 RepID=UPI003D9A3076
MFAIDERLLLTSAPDFPLIVSDYEVLHFDEMPILFTGTTKYQARVIASSVEEDDDTDRFFYVIVTADTYSSFIRRRISYREIILRARSIFVVDKGTGGRVTVYVVPVEDIPDEYLPLEDSYCPERSLRPSLTFDASMRGKRADMHQAYPSDIRTVETSLSGIVSDALVSVSEAKRPPRTVLRPYGEGSFRLRFSVEEEAPPQLGFAAHLHPEYARLYIDFCLNRFQDEVDAIGDGELHKAPHFAALLTTYLRINMFGGNLRDGGMMSPAVATESLLLSLRRSVERLVELSDIIGQNFSSIEVFNVYEDSEEALIGAMDASSVARISASVERYDVRVGGVSEDAHAQEYEILIYNLNTETRKGSAYLILRDLMPRVRITIGGSGPLEETRYAESLYKNKRISVSARAKRAKDKIVSLSIEY